MKLYFLIGPTASGKSSAGLRLAEELGAEIISLDSMKVYRGMDLGTAKPDASARARVRHHLIDVVDPNEPFSVGRYLELVRPILTTLEAPGKRPLFLGGTALYLNSLARGLFDGPPADLEVRDRLKQQAEAEGTETLHQRLAEVDPPAAERIHPHDLRRLVRALEVFELTGTPISAWQTEHTLPIEKECVLLGIRRRRADLYARIHRRVDRMFAAGLIEETQGLLSRYGSLSRPASQALGYREVLEHLNGEQTRAETIEAVKTHTRQFAKRQATWFRKFPQTHWTDVEPDDSAEAICDQLLLALKAAEREGSREA